MVKKDIFDRELKIGDYVAYPKYATIEVAKVLGFGKGECPTVKISCLRQASYNTVWKMRSSMSNLRRHNSFAYRMLYDFIILDLGIDFVDESKLVSYKKLIKDEKDKSK